MRKEEEGSERSETGGGRAGRLGKERGVKGEQREMEV